MPLIDLNPFVEDLALGIHAGHPQQRSEPAPAVQFVEFVDRQFAIVQLRHCSLPVVSWGENILASRDQEIRRDRAERCAALTQTSHTGNARKKPASAPSAHRRALTGHPADMPSDNHPAGRQLVSMRWGMPPPPKFGGPPVTNIRNTSSPHWRGWLSRKTDAWCQPTAFRRRARPCLNAKRRYAASDRRRRSR